MNVIPEWIEEGSVLVWARRGGSTLLDQAFFSAGNFLVGLLLARWLPEEEYGGYVVGFSVFLLVNAIQNAVLTEPMLVFGAGKFRDDFGAYLRILVRGLSLVSLIAALVLGIAALVLRALESSIVSLNIGALVFSAPALLFLWFARQAFYARERPSSALRVSVTYTLLAVAAVAAMEIFGLLTGFAGLLAMGGAGLAASAWAIGLLRESSAPSQLSPGQVLQAHREYGGWNLIAVVVYWLSSQVLFLLIPAVLGLEESGRLAAVQNYFRPIHLLLQSFALLALPALARLEAGGAAQRMERRFSVLILSVGLVIFTYVLVVYLLRDWLSEMIYAGKYAGSSTVILLLGLSYVFSSSLRVALARLKARADTRTLALVWGLSAVVVLVLSVPALNAFGLAGGVATLALSYLVALSMGLARLSRRADSG